MSKIVCNIPHSSLRIPEWSKSDFMITPNGLQQLNEKMVDKNVDVLFDFVSEENKMVSSVSRLVVDMERYRDDADEPMSRLGMGLFYTHNDIGQPIRVRGLSYEKCLSLYDEYHRGLTSKVSAVLNHHKSCWVLDCHSFHSGLQYTGYQIEDYPDVCIGFNETSPSTEVLWIRNLFEQEGYSVKFNLPFSGSLVPLKYLNNARVKSVMLEFNRTIYDGSDENFDKIKSLCRAIYDYLNLH